MSDPFLISLLEKSRQIHETKSHDYATADDCHSNFKFQEFVMAPFSDVYKPYAGMVGQKLARLSQLLSGKEPKHESIEDSFVDLVTYCALMGARWRHEQANKAIQLAEAMPEWPDDGWNAEHEQEITT